MSDDDSGELNLAPLPRHERGWRHPAERADDERREYQRESAPPPLGRRARAYVGITGVLVAVAVMSVAIPKGISDYASSGDSTLPPDTLDAPRDTVPVKGGFNPTVAVAGSHGATSALAVGGGHLITSLEDVTSEGEVSITLPTGVDVAASVVASDPESGLALLRVDDGDLAELDRANLTVLGGGATPRAITRDAIATLSLIDWRGAQPVRAGGGIVTSPRDDQHLVTTGRVINGVAAAVTDDGAVVGVAVRRAQATWLVPMEQLRALLDDAFSLGGAEG